MSKREHNNVWCDKYSNNVLSDERGNCSLCGASLHELTPDEAFRLIDLFEDEADALAIAKETAVSGTR